MTQMKKILLLGAALLCATSAMAARDGFNRSRLGNNWVQTDPTLSIANDQLVGTALALGYDQKSSNDNKVSATVYLNGTDTEYGAVAVGDVASGTNAFVKIQEQNADGVFEYGAFYIGDNGGGNFFALSSTVPSPARLVVTMCGTTAVMKITSSAGTQKYKYDYGTSVGTGGGLGTYGNISLDNYASNSTTCTDAEGAKWVTPSGAKDLSLAK
ncbi:MAG TPA: hypothetical protein VHT03_13225 [Rhizomicrobium sp.]|jgi:hypothetical protein|nr:hypothetical protein [Rhizomicrobium sp.]